LRRIVRRLLDLPLPRGRSAFLWGPRRTGKTYWLRNRFGARPDVRIIDLLETDTFADYASRPALLRERFDGRLTVIDEVQKVPALLDEVHWLIENRRAQFLLTGSSARKLRRGHANLLAGRA
jgi:predicted AAA+ superfamily ATPase